MNTKKENMQQENFHVHLLSFLTYKEDKESVVNAIKELIESGIY